MRKIILAMAIGAGFIAVPASAQDDRYGQYGDGYGRGGSYYNDNRYGSDIGRLRYEIDRAIQSGELSWQQRDYFRRQLDYLYRLDSRYRGDGYSSWERRDMDRRTDQIQRYLDEVRGDRRGWRDDDRYEDRNGDGRYDWRDR